MTALAPRNRQTSVDSPISPVNSAMAKLERGSDNLRPWRSATRPQTGEAKAVSKDVEPVVTPDQISMPFVDLTPSLVAALYGPGVGWPALPSSGGPIPTEASFAVG